MHHIKKLALSVFFFYFGFTVATHAQQVTTLFTKLLPEEPCKEIEVITVSYAPERSERSTGMMRMRLSMFSKRKLSAGSRRHASEAWSQGCVLRIT
jgi:hypothetical protein